MSSKMTETSNYGRPSKLVCLCTTICAVLIFCQLERVFLPEALVSFIIVGRALKQELPTATQFVTLTAGSVRSRSNFDQTEAIITKETLRGNHILEEKPGEEAMSLQAEGRPLNSNDCPPSREARWEFESFRKGWDQKAEKRLLIGLYSGYGVYTNLLEKTAYINRAYANEWEHDVVLVQGAAMTMEELDGDCEPPAYRATYNKIPLLEYALSYKDQYDQLLILDTDALICDLSFDVTTLLPDDEMLAAQKVRAADEGKHTWDVNAGVTLWNLNHPQTERLFTTWKENAEYGMLHGFHASNDQFHLHAALREGGMEPDVHGLVAEFNYGHGTIVKHFIRKPEAKQWGEASILDRREDRIEALVSDMCQEHRHLCDDIERKVYMS